MWCPKGPKIGNSDFQGPQEEFAGDEKASKNEKQARTRS